MSPNLHTKIFQASLSFLRYSGIDLYSLYGRHAPSLSLRRALRPFSSLKEDGLTLAFDFSAHNSHAQVGRDFLKKISQTSIPFALFDTHLKGTSSTTIPKKETNEILKFASAPPNQRRMIHFSSTNILYSSKLSISATPFWEFEDGMLHNRPSFFKDCHQAIVFSDFCKNAIRHDAPPSFPIHKLPYPFPLQIPPINKTATRTRFQIPQNAFSVFFNFNLGAGMDRKNPFAAIDAFVNAFPSQNASQSCLVFKISSKEDCLSDFNAICSYAQKKGIENRFITITDALTHDDILALTASSNAYLSLHRGEGLGLGMLEAMSVKTPVIATAYGGNMEFCTPRSSLLVPFSLIPVQTSFKPYQAVTQWADPDLSVASAHLRHLYSSPSFAQNLSNQARSLIEELYSLTSFESSLRSLLPLL